MKLHYSKDFPGMLLPESQIAVTQEIFRLRAMNGDSEEIAKARETLRTVQAEKEIAIGQAKLARIKGDETVNLDAIREEWAATEEAAREELKALQGEDASGNSAKAQLEELLKVLSGHNAVANVQVMSSKRTDKATATLEAKLRSVNTSR